MSISAEQVYALSKKYTADTVEGAGAIKGKSAYQIAVDNGFIGTEQQWLDSLQGEPGPQGLEGPQGEKGEKGDKGDPGSGALDISYDALTETATFQITT